MGTFVMLTKLGSGVSRTATNLEQLERSAVDHVRQQCPNVHWLHSYAVLGRPDYIDIFTAPDIETAMKGFGAGSHVRCGRHGDLASGGMGAVQDDCPLDAGVIGGHPSRGQLKLN